MATRATLLRLAEQAERDAVAWDKRAAAAREQAKTLRELAEGMEKVLTKGPGLSTLDKNMEQSHRLAISRGRSSSKVDAEFKNAYRSKRFTLTTLAEAVSCDAPLLSKYRRKLRRIPQERAEAIAKLIPWPADAKHWPGGIVPKD